MVWALPSSQRHRGSSFPMPTRVLADAELRSRGGGLLMRPRPVNPTAGGQNAKLLGGRASPSVPLTRAPSPRRVDDGSSYRTAGTPASFDSQHNGAEQNAASEADQFCATSNLSSCSAWDCGIGDDGVDFCVLTQPPSSMAPDVSISPSPEQQHDDDDAAGTAVKAGLRARSPPRSSTSAESPPRGPAQPPSPPQHTAAPTPSAEDREVFLPDDIYGSARVSEFWQGLQEYSCLANTYVYDDIWASGGGLTTNVEHGLDAARVRAAAAAINAVSVGGPEEECFVDDVVLEPNVFAPAVCPEVAFPVVAPPYFPVVAPSYKVRGGSLRVSGGGGSYEGYAHEHAVESVSSAWRVDRGGAPSFIWGMRVPETCAVDSAASSPVAVSPPCIGKLSAPAVGHGYAARLWESAPSQPSNGGGGDGGGNGGGSNADDGISGHASSASGRCGSGSAGGQSDPGFTAQEPASAAAASEAASPAPGAAAVQEASTKRATEATSQRATSPARTALSAMVEGGSSSGGADGDGGRKRTASSSHEACGE